MIDTNGGSDNRAGGAMDTFLWTSLTAVVGVVLLALAVAGVPEESGIALVIGGALLLAPTIAALTGRCDRHG
jgi:hypothetical protein